MTLARPPRRPSVPRFTGTKGQRAANRLTHAWQQVPNPFPFMPIPASFLHTKTDAEIREALKSRHETLPRCSKCGAMGGGKAADWPCGEAPAAT